MTPTEAVALCRYVKALCPQQAIDSYTPDAWHDLLAGIDLEDAKDASRTVAMRQPFVAPAEIIGEVRRVRHDRAVIADSADVPPEIEAIDDPEEFDRAYRRWRGQLRARLAAGGDLPVIERAVSKQPPPEAKALIDRLRVEAEAAERERAAKHTPAAERAAELDTQEEA